MRVPSAILICLLCVAAARAQSGGASAAERATEEFATDELQFGSIGWYWDNDGAYLKPNQYSDENYTNGGKIDFGFQGALADRWANRLPTIPVFGLDDKAEIDPAGRGRRGALGVGVSQLMFTPEDLTRSDLIEDDRPYAGYLGFNFFLQRAYGNDFEHFEIQAGVVGPASFAREIQKMVHATFPDNIEPRGWSHQLDNEPVFNFNYRRRWRMDLLHPESPVGLQFIPGGGFNLGNMRTSARVDFTGRFGWNLPHDFGPSRLLDIRDVTARPGDNLELGDWGVYVYGRLGGRAVLRDIFLDGNTFESSHSVAREPFVAELQAGIVARWRFLQFGYSQTWISREFERESPSSHGSFTIDLHFPF